MTSSTVAVDEVIFLQRITLSRIQGHYFTVT